MEDYEVGGVGDLISGTRTPGKGKVLQKKTPIKGPIGTPRGQQNGKTPQKRKSGVTAPQSAKKAKAQQPPPEEEEVNASEVEEEENNASEVEEDSNEDIGERAEQDSGEQVDDETDEDDNDEDEDEEGVDDEEEGVDDEEEGVDDEEDVEDDEEVEGEDDEDDDEEAEGEDEDSDEEDHEALYRLAGEEDDESDDDEGPEEQSTKQKKKKGEATSLDPHGDRTIFVGNVKVGMAKELLIKHFKKYGSVESVRFRSIAVENPNLEKKVSIQKKKLHPKRTVCNAYVRFENAESAKEAVAGENGKEFCGLHIRVTMANELMDTDIKKGIFLGNLSFATEDEALWKAFEPCGEIASVRIVRDKHTEVSKGFAYVNFKSTDSVELALAMGPVTVDKRILRISTCNSTPQKPSSTTVNECCVFVAGFSAKTPKEVITKPFKEFGEVAKCRIVHDKVTKQQLGCAFITFKTTEATQKAVDAGAVLVNTQEVTIQLPRKTLKGVKKGKKSTKEGRIEKKKDGARLSGGLQRGRGRGFSRGSRGFSRGGGDEAKGYSRDGGHRGRGFSRGGGDRGRGFFRGVGDRGRGFFRGVGDRGRGFFRGVDDRGRGFFRGVGDRGRGFPCGGPRGRGYGGGSPRGRGEFGRGGRGSDRGGRGRVAE